MQGRKWSFTAFALVNWNIEFHDKIPRQIGLLWKSVMARMLYQLKFIHGNPHTNTMVSGGRAFGRCLGHEASPS